ncbi:hypothetical protein KIW84_064809 [Lathyrus oleraceus]|uniref:DUF659 domain-containing protein n=1 Tax=Pisum sativum TaxID=3888 RepID=A0A9D5A6M8_PEA|nr:hypothetical protein KIW84_064809 [Pisum sativum]
MIDVVVEEIEEDNVIQIVTDNAANYKVAGEMLMQTRNKLYLTHCAAHCLDLMLEDLEKKVSVHEETIPKVCLYENKEALIRMFTSKEWKWSRCAKLRDGKAIEDVVLDKFFWKNIVISLRGAIPLIEVLRLVDSDQKPVIGLIYEVVDQAKEEIQKNFNGVNKSYKPIWNMIGDRWDKMLHRSLHVAAYYLNPQMHHDPRFKADIEVKKGLMNCLTKMVGDPEEQAKIEVQMHDFKKQLEYFGTKFAKQTLEKSTLTDWWDSVGFEYCPKKGRRTFEVEFDDLGSDDDWLMDEDGDIEISDEDFIQMNQKQIQEDNIFVHDLEDEHDGRIDENEFDDNFEDENKDGGDNEDNDDPLSDYDQL